MIFLAVRLTTEESTELILPSNNWYNWYMPCAGRCAPSLLRLLIALNNQESISKYAIPMFLRLEQYKREQLSDSVLFAIGSEFLKIKDWNNLFQISKYHQGTVLKVLFSCNNPSSISQYIHYNIKFMSLKAKRLMLENLILSYELELIERKIVKELKAELSNEDLSSLEILQDFADSQQCKICTDRSISKYFTCLGAKKYSHGACRDCFEMIKSSKNAACPFCREPINLNV